MYVLARFVDCVEFYRGPHQGDSTFVVGRGHVEEERLFRRKDLVAASEYAKLTRLQVESCPNTSMCDEAIRELWGE